MRPRRTQRAIATLALSLLLAACVSDAPEPSATAPDTGRQLLERGVRAYQSRDLEAAAADFTEALSYYRGYDLADGTVRSRINLARVELDLGRPEVARAHLDAARRVAERAEGADFTARLDLLASTIALEIGDLDQAASSIEPHLSHLTPNAEVAGATAPSQQQLSFLANRTTLAFERNANDREQWLARLANAHAAQEVTLPAVEARLYRLRARLAQEQGTDEQALSHLERALELYKRARTRSGIATTLEAMAKVYAGRGAVETARAHLDRALYLHVAMQDTRASRSNLENRIAWLEPATEREQRLRSWIAALDDRASVDWTTLRDSVIAEAAPGS